MSSKDWTSRQLAAECMATALFVWAGTGSAVASNHWMLDGAGDNDPAQLLGIAIAFGLTISVLAYGIGHISGGHINPAVTLAFMVLGKQSIVGGLLYMLAQCIGAVWGSLLLWGCTASLTAHCDDIEGLAERLDEFNLGICKGSSLEGGGYGPAWNLGANAVNERVTDGCAFLLELIGTYVLVVTVLNSAVSAKSAAGNAAPMAIGWAVLIVHINLIPYTGCGINPARSLGPMVVDSFGGAAAKVWVRGAWVYYTAPFVGSLLAAATYKYVFEEPAAEVPAEEERESKAPPSPATSKHDVEVAAA